MYNESDLINALVGQKLEDLWTVIPARVLEYFPERQQATVKPVLIRTYEDNLTIPLESIQDVPVVFPSAGGGILSFPVEVGDLVLLLFSTLSIDSWKYSSGDGDVVSKEIRSHDYSDPFAIPCAYTSQNNLKPSPDNVELKFSGTTIKIAPSGDVTVDVTGGTNVTINCQQATINAPQTTCTGELRVDGGISVGADVVTDSGISLNNHLHGGVTPGGGVTQPPQ